MTLEWSVPISLDRITSAPFSMTIEPNQQEKEALAKRFHLVSLKDLKAHFTITLHPETKGYLIFAQIKAQIVQSCVISLQDVPADIAFTIDLLLRPLEKEEILEDILGGFDETRDIEPLENDKIDLAELAAQYLSLHIDPYPKSQHASNEILEKLQQESKGYPLSNLEKLQQKEK